MQCTVGSVDKFDMSSFFHGHFFLDAFDVLQDGAYFGQKNSKKKLLLNRQFDSAHLFTICLTVLWTKYTPNLNEINENI